MAEKVKKLNLERDYKKYLYFIDGNGNVCQKSKSGEGDSKALRGGSVSTDSIGRFAERLGPTKALQIQRHCGIQMASLGYE